MDCLQLTREGGSIGQIWVCRSQVAISRLVIWATANLIGTVGLLIVTLIVLLFLWRIGRSILTKQRARYVAKKRAEALLRASITEEQYQHLVDRGYLEIPSRLYPGYLYRISRTQQRVQIYETNSSVATPYARKLAELCVVSCDSVPDADMVLAHKLMIEADEQAYLSIANRIG